MSDTNQITVRGRVGTDPDVLFTTNGKQITKFRLGSTRSYRDATGAWRETDTEWFTVKTWGEPGVLVRQSIRRGMPVIVQGVLGSEEWDSGERTHHTNVITAGAIGVDIKYGLVTFAKVTRQAPAENGQADASADAAAEQPSDASEYGENEEAPETSEELTDPALAPDGVDPSAWEKAPATA